MSDAIAVGDDDGVPRCGWAGRAPGVMRDYHDHEWGVPIAGESAYFERMTLEAFQSGLSWSTILNKRDNFRRAFHGFDVEAIAAYDDTDRARLMADAGIVRNRLKIDATIVNAHATLALRDARDVAGLPGLIESFKPTVSPVPTSYADLMTTSPESLALSKELKRRGFTFVGPTTMFALMEATGLVPHHLRDCFRR